MKPKIETIEQLQAEIKRLEVRSEELKTTLKLDVEELKEELKPGNILADTLSGFSVFNFISGDTVPKKILAFIMKLIAQQVFMAAESGMEKKARAIFGNVSEKVAEFLRRIFRKKAEPEPEENGNYTGE